MKRAWGLGALAIAALLLGATVVATAPGTRVVVPLMPQQRPFTEPTASPTAPAGGPPMMPPDRAIWRPAPVTSWQIQFTGLPIDLSVAAEMWDLDLFDTSPSTIALLHARGSRVVCYINAGAWEDWRPDADRFPAFVKGNPLEGWPGERWLDIRRMDALLPIIEARLDLCRQKGFDGVEFDNVDGYSNRTGFPLTAADQVAYNRALAAAAHARGLSVGLKNALDLIPQLEPFFDWALNEQCFQYNECDKLLPFVRAGKAVFTIEYHLPPSAFCARANALNFNSLHKNVSLDAYRVACR
ncbi:MAG: endo alpha-1,4 polygalactosaminidase [Dehalococcoidia bacterium]|nr:endo alpha-1,4 polygalactosaminidase [Dehalococcoidia bacterium]